QVSGRFGPGEHETVGYETMQPYDPLQMVAGDFDQDGRTDLAVTVFRTNEVAMLLTRNRPVGRMFAPAVLIGLEGIQPDGITSGDFDSDGVLDLAVACRSGHVVVLRGRAVGGVADGTFEVAGVHQISGSAYDISAADVDTDGNLDLLVSDEEASTISTL